MDSQEIAQKQLEQFYSAVAQGNQMKMTTRNWLVTVWLGITVVIGSDTLEVSFIITLALYLVPVILFWFFEAMLHTLLSIDQSGAWRLEEYLSSSNSDIDLPQNYYLMHRHASETFKEKCYCFLRSMFLAETVILFYLLMIVLSFLFAALLAPD